VRARAISNAKMPANMSVETDKKTHAYKRLLLFSLSLISSLNSCIKASLPEPILYNILLIKSRAFIG
jgi:hypothetical protein